MQPNKSSLAFFHKVYKITENGALNSMQIILRIKILFYCLIIIMYVGLFHKYLRLSVLGSLHPVFSRLALDIV